MPQPTPAAVERAAHNQADFKCAAYLMMIKPRKIVDDVFEGTLRLRAESKEYLPQMPAEEDDQYKARVNDSELFPAFRRTVCALTGLVFHKDPTPDEDVPERIKALLENIDNAGTHLAVFAREFFQTVLQKGHALIYVDMPPPLKASKTGSAKPTRKDDRLAKRRPWCVTYSPESIINWRTKEVDGETVLDLVVLEELSVEPSGKFGEKMVRRYRVLRPGSWELYRINVAAAGTAAAAATAKLTREDGGTTGLDYIPVVAAYGDRRGILTSRPPLVDLAILNIKHFRMTSDLHNVMHVANVPILWAKGRNPEMPFVAVGPTTLVDLQGQDAGMGYAEHSAHAIPTTQQEVANIERRMAVAGLEMLAQKDSTSGQKTATEHSNNFVQSTSELAAVTRSVADALEQMLGIMADYMDIGRDKGGSITLNVEYNRLVFSNEKLNTLRDYVESKILSTETILELLVRAGELPDDFNVKEELKRLFGDDWDKSESERDAALVEQIGGGGAEDGDADLPEGGGTTGGTTAAGGATGGATKMAASKKGAAKKGAAKKAPAAK